MSCLFLGTQKTIGVVLHLIHNACTVAGLKTSLPSDLSRLSVSDRNIRLRIRRMIHIVGPKNSQISSFIIRPERGHFYGDIDGPRLLDGKDHFTPNNELVPGFNDQSSGRGRERFYFGRSWLRVPVAIHPPWFHAVSRRIEKRLAIQSCKTRHKGIRCLLIDPQLGDPIETRHMLRFGTRILHLFTIRVQGILQPFAVIADLRFELNPRDFHSGQAKTPFQTEYRWIALVLKPKPMSQSRHETVPTCIPPIKNRG